MIKTSTRKHGTGYMGVITCSTSTGIRLWSESCGITRSTKEDAKSDAEWTKEQHEAASVIE